MPPIQDETGPKRRLRLWSRKGVAVLLAIALFFHVGARHAVRSAFEHIYTPPALTRDKLSVFAQLVRLAERHREHPDIFLNMRGNIRFGMFPYSANVPDDLKKIERDMGLTPEECVKLAMIPSGMRRVGCLHAYVKGSYVIFISTRNYVLPTSPGVVYSLDGSNPNDADDDFLKGKRPFVSVKDGWYISRHLVVSPFHRINAEWPLPESLIDHSTRGNSGNSGGNGGQTRMALP